MNSCAGLHMVATFLAVSLVVFGCGQAETGAERADLVWEDAKASEVQGPSYPDGWGSWWEPGMDSECVPDCDSRECGDDGCGGECGSCGEEMGCAHHTCYLLAELPLEARISCAEGREVIPGTVLHLSGEGSIAPFFTIKGYEWSVEQPEGSFSRFSPSGISSSPEFEVLVAGTYVFGLKIMSMDAVWSQQTARMSVVVIPDESIHVELLWQTPGDPDESDSGPVAGADLDLHFTHPDADIGTDHDGDGQPDPWFDQPFDCYWYNRYPNWADSDPNIPDNPRLDRTDEDGAGPELLSLNIPEEVTYRVGVNCWDDHGHGPSLATVKVFFFSELVFLWSGIELRSGDMWEVCEIRWPSRDAVPVIRNVSKPKITPDYPTPLLQGREAMPQYGL